MKQTIILLIIIASGLNARSQVTMDKYVVASGGTSATAGTITADYTVGQAVINYVTTGTLEVYEGFHPAIFSSSLNTPVTKKEGLVVNAFPNPAGNVLHISIHQPNANPVVIEVADMKGLLVNRLPIVPAKDIARDIDFTALPPGLYIITVRGSDENAQAMKIVKR